MDMKKISLLAVTLFGAAAAIPSSAQGPAQTLDIQEWPVPYAESRPRDPYVDAQGRVWFVGQRGNYIAYLEPQSGQFRRFEIEDGALPHNLVVGPDGAIWYAGNGNGHIGRLDPATGQVRRFAMPEGARDPHTLVFAADGNLWFTMQGANRIGHLMTGTGEVHVIEVEGANSRPYGIVLDAQ